MVLSEAKTILGASYAMAEYGVKQTSVGEITKSTQTENRPAT
jgi:hypothetical protein